MRLLIAISLGLTVLVMGGCGSSESGEAVSGNIENAAPDPGPTPEAANAQTMEEWAKANPNNGAPGNK